jgi:hypothetical protein
VRAYVSRDYSGITQGGVRRVRVLGKSVRVEWVWRECGLCAAEAWRTQWVWKTDGTWLEAASSGDRVFSEVFISTSYTEVLRRGRNSLGNPTTRILLPKNHLLKIGR